MRCTVLAFAVLALAPAAAAAAETDHVNRTAALAPGGTLRLKNFSGRVTITGTDRTDAAIDAVRRGTRERLDHIKLDIHTEGSTLVVNANQQEESVWWWARRNRVVETDLDIQVPRSTNLDVDVFSAPVTVHGVEGTHKIHGFSSRLRLEGVSGAVRVHTFSGSVEIGPKTWEPDQVIDVDTFSGNIALHLPESARGSVTFNSFSGHLNCDLPLTLRSSSRRSVKAELGGASTGGSLRFKTFSGSVRIAR